VATAGAASGLYGRNRSCPWSPSFLTVDVSQESPAAASITCYNCSQIMPLSTPRKVSQRCTNMQLWYSAKLASRVRRKA
jgi:hypothetical protein